MKWKFNRIDWQSKGNCWRWWKITRSIYYAGNVTTITWGRIVIWFERRVWIHSQNERMHTPIP